MAEFKDIEDAVVALLGGIVDGAAPVFAVVRGAALADRKAGVAALVREIKPAALVAVDGREKRTSRAGAVGGPRVIVLLAAAGLRSVDAGRRGDVDTRGAHELAERATAALDGAALAEGRRLAAVDEQVVAADERGVVVEQRYVVERAADGSGPTLDDEAVAGSDSDVSVTVGPRRAEAVEFGFPGVDGAFRHELGIAAPPIQWAGRLRAATHAELTGIEAGLEALVGDGVARTMADAAGRSFAGCVATSFSRRGPRQVHSTTGAVTQDFEMVFVQTGGGQGP